MQTAAVTLLEMLHEKAHLQAPDSDLVEHAPGLQVLVPCIYDGAPCLQDTAVHPMSLLTARPVAVGRYVPKTIQYISAPPAAAP